MERQRTESRCSAAPWLRCVAIVGFAAGAVTLLALQACARRAPAAPGAAPRFECALDDARCLAEVTRAASVDAALDVFLRAAESRSGEEARRFEELAREAADAHVAARLASELGRYRLVFVPGFGYRRDPSTGADFAAQRSLLQRHGVATELLPTDETGTVEANAAQIRAYLDRTQRLDGRPVILISASKAGAETALALDGYRPGSTDAGVVAWVNVGGLLRGTLLADPQASRLRAVLGRVVFSALGLSPAALESVRRSRRAAAFASLVLPRSLLQVHYVAAPRSAEIARDVRGRFSFLSRYGPNDGLTLLADAVTRDGLVIPERGVDHYFRHPQIAQRTVALALLVAEQLEARSAARAAPASAG